MLEIVRCKSSYKIFRNLNVLNEVFYLFVCVFVATLEYTNK